MKNRLFLISLFLYPLASFAQLTPEQRIQDSIIGWWDNLQYDNKLSPGAVADRKNKIDNLNLLVDWMKKSYTPVAGLGTYSRFINNQQYGVQFAVWNVSFKKEWLDKRGKFRPIPEELTKFGIYINSIPGSYPVEFINTTDRYVFTWQPDGFSPNEQSREARKGLDPKIHPNAYNYITHINDATTVYLAPGNKLPFVPVLIGEYLTMAESAIDSLLSKERKKVESQWPGNKKAQQDAFAYREKTIEKYRSNIQQLKIRYKNKLNEPAVTRNMQPSLYSFELDPDPFTISQSEKLSGTFFPLYKIETATLVKCKLSEPQWIAVWVPYENKESGNQLLEMYRSVTENLNFGYIYNHFFDKQKNNGRAYFPSNMEEQQARLENYRKKIHHKMPAARPNIASGVYFKDDFLEHGPDGKPIGWYYSSIGKHAQVTGINGFAGQWLKPGYNNDVSPVWLRRPLPENFSLEFSLVTDSFTTRTGGAMSIHLSSYPLEADGRENAGMPGNTIDMTIISGNERDFNNNNYMGETRIDWHSQPALYKDNYSEGLFYKEPNREFTNIKQKVHVRIVFENGNISLFMNGKQTASMSDFKMRYGKDCTGCKWPQGIRFNTLTFRNTTNDGKNTGIYLSNVLIRLL